MSKKVKQNRQLEVEANLLPDLPIKKHLPPASPAITHAIYVSKRVGQFVHKIISFHDQFIFFFPIKGDANVLLDKKLLSVPENNALLIFPHQFHNLARTNDENILWVIISFRIQDYQNIEKLRDTPVKLNDESLEWLESIITWANRANQNNNLATRITHMLPLILAEMTFLSASHKKSSQGNFWNTAGQKLVSQAANFISKNILKAITINDLADHLNVSPSLIQKHFKKTLATSAASYIRSARILHSANILRNTNKTIGEISKEYNFGDPYSYSKTFKNVMGLSPRTYRESYKKRSL